MLSVPDQLREISEISESLSGCERRTLLYLCGDVATDHSVAHVKELLRSEVLHRGNPELFLQEVLLHLGRFDLLRRVFQVSREDMERRPDHTQVLPRFRVLMAKISEDLLVEDLNCMKFLLSSSLSREKMENAKSFLDVVSELEKLDSVSPERVNVIEECLMNIGRIDLAKKVVSYKMSVETPEHRPSQQQSFRASPIKHGQPLCGAGRVNTPLSVHRGHSCETRSDWYKFTSNPRGVCVIIDCVGNDGEMLEETFKNLHFSVVLHRWLSAADTLSALTETFKQIHALRGDAFVCCIISRGTTDHLLGTDQYGRGLPMDNVRRLFTGDACPALAGKPKLFFIQRYSVAERLPGIQRPQQDEELETDGFDGRSSCSYIPADADMFWSHCWTHDRQLERRRHRSVYLKALTDSFHRTHRRNLVDVHTEVNAAVFDHNGRNPGENYQLDVKHTLRKDLFLQ